MAQMSFSYSFTQQILQRLREYASSYSSTSAPSSFASKTSFILYFSLLLIFGGSNQFLMGNCLTPPLNVTDFSSKSKALPIETVFKLPSSLPSWPQGGGFSSGGSINLGGLEVCQISTFSKVWATHEGGPDNLGATFFEPSSIPAGFFMLGSYSQPNNKPLFGWVLAGKDAGAEALKMPVDYSLLWSSNSTKIKQDGNGYIWLPIPPDGYKSVGHIVTSSSEKPPLDKIRCIRSDLTDQCEPDSWIWGTNVGGFTVSSLRPVTRGTQALGVSVGTFTAQFNGVTSPIPLACLKNSASSLSSMPNLSQIEALFKTYSPLIYLHPDEKYLPAAVSWLFNNGAQLYKKGDESHPVSIEPTGSNLPQGGSDDGAYWLDLPIDEAAKDKVKQGDLGISGSYLHVKPMLGGTFTDIAIWVFYPFNGPARAKVNLLTIPLGKIGEHVGDWEHVTLRISNFNGELWRVYFSEHSGGQWVDASELEFEGGNKVVTYSSLSGHAFYPHPGLFLQGSGDIGLRNDAAKSDKTMDTGLRYVIVSAEYLGTIIEPPWLNYTRKWGPKISYDTAAELEKLKKIFPGIKKLVKSLPSEVLGQEGPTGPKVKSSWNGDEKV